MHHRTKLALFNYTILITHDVSQVETRQCFLRISVAASEGQAPALDCQ